MTVLETHPAVRIDRLGELVAHLGGASEPAAAAAVQSAIEATGAGTATDRTDEDRLELVARALVTLKRRNRS